MRLFRRTVLLLFLIVFWMVRQMPDDKLHLVACEVGQGDAGLVVWGNFQMLIDVGPASNKVLACLSRYVPFWDKQIELVISSHPQADHIGGLAAVLAHYRVGSLVVSPFGVTDAMLRWQKKGEIKLRMLAKGDRVSYRGLRFDVLWPDKDSDGVVSDINQKSLVGRLVYGSFAAIYTGDIGVAEETALVKYGLGGATILKVAHHGSKYSSDFGFLEVVSPKEALVSVGKKNSYGHPTAEVLARLKAVGARIWRTDRDGNVEVVTDGKNYSVKKSVGLLK